MLYIKIQPQQFLGSGEPTPREQKGLLHGIGNLHWFLPMLGIG